MYIPELSGPKPYSFHQVNLPIYARHNIGALVMKTNEKPNKLLLFIIEKIIEIFHLTGNLCVVIVTVELLNGFPVTDGKPIDIEKFLYLTCFSYFIVAVTTYCKIRLNCKR
jgi:hypothetical protein